MDADHRPIEYDPKTIITLGIIFGVIVALISAWIVSDLSWVKIIAVVVLSGLWVLGLAAHRATVIEYGVIFILGLVPVLSVSFYFKHFIIIWPYILAAFFGTVLGTMDKIASDNWNRRQLYGDETPETYQEPEEHRPNLP